MREEREGACPMRTTVGIIGAGPAGLLLARLLHNAGIDSVVLESRDRAYVEHRQRAGILEQGTVDVLRAAGAGERMDREGLRHDGIELRFDRQRHRVDFPALTGGRSVMVYAQTEVCKDLIALQLKEGGPLLFEAEALAVEGAGRATARGSGSGMRGARTCWSASTSSGCDGFWGVARKAIPAELTRVFERTYPFGWLGILADVPPSHDELVYARHDRGFALLSMRSPVRLPALPPGARGHGRRGVGRRGDLGRAGAALRDRRRLAAGAGAHHRRSPSPPCAAMSTSRCGTAGSSSPVTPPTSCRRPAPRG